MDIRTIADEVLEVLVIPSFTDLGFLARRRLFDWEDVSRIRLDGCAILITGATSGLGFETARELMGMGASVRILGRSQESAETACERLRDLTPGADVHSYVADMSEPSQVREAAERFIASESRLDVLVHNAGALLTERRTTSQGLEATFASMVLGPFVLTQALTPLLVRTAEAHRPTRIISVASGGMYTQGLHVDDLQMEHEPYRGTVAYARAKRAQIALTGLWADRLWERGVVANAMHPGWADTPGIEAALPRFRKIIGSRLRSAAEGADTIIWLAASAEAARRTGLFWLDRRVRKTERLPGTRVTDKDARALWEMCERLSD